MLKSTRPSTGYCWAYAHSLVWPWTARGICMKTLALLAATCGMLSVAACSSGGGTSPTTGSVSGNASSSAGSSNNIPPANTSSSASSSTNIPPATVTIGAPGTISYGANSPTQAAGTTPNFTTSPPPASTTFPVNQTVLSVTPTSISDANAGGGTITFQAGTTIISGTTFSTVDLKIPSLSLDLPNLSGVPYTVGPGNNPTTVFNLNYTVMGAWTNTDVTNPNGYAGAFVTGLQTPTSGIPTFGKAVYQGQFSGGAGVVSGIVFVPSANGTIDTARVTGAAQIAVDFLTHDIGGGLTGMQSPNGSWNDVAFTGKLAGTGLSGTTTATGLSRDPKFGMTTSADGTAATGTFSGALYGPGAQELGAVWTLHDNSGKSAIGIVAATRAP